MQGPAGERRTVSVLLVDVVDSTAIGERLGPERSKFLFDEVVRLIAAEVRRYGGTVAQLTGDGLYALFGAPIAHDDDAERAVRAALAMHAALAAYAQEVLEGYEVVVQARIGVNTGPVVLLPDDSAPEERYNALGDTVNVAARLQTRAGAGGVAVGPETARRVGRSFALEPLGPLELKGKSEAVEAYRVGAAQPAGELSRSQLVGRDEQLAALEEVFEHLFEGRGAIVAVTGEAGIGKSRLAAEARGRFEGRVLFLEAQAVSYAEEIPYYPLRSLLRGWLGTGLDDPEARQRLELKTRLAATLGDRAERAYPFLASLLGLTQAAESGEPLGGLAPDAARRETHAAVADLVRTLSLAQPLCVVLEDLHFADEPTLALAEGLLALAEEEAVALLLLYRSDPDASAWDLGEHARRRYRHLFHELALEPLDLVDSAELAAAAAGATLPEELARLLSERTGGNPFFLVEALRDLVEQGALRRVDGQVELAVAGNELALPAAVQQTLQARLDRLPDEARELAAVASVVGRNFALPLLERMLPAEHVHTGLSELQRLDLVVEERRRPAPEYRFRHGLVQEAAYASLLEARRRELHLCVGEALESLVAEGSTVADGTLARHFALADEPVRAARYLLAAGDAARAVDAEEEAITSYRSALAFLDRLGDTQRARRTLYKIALAHHLAFGFAAASAAWAEAAARPAPPPERLEPTERITCTGASAGEGGWFPGQGWDIFSEKVTKHLFRGLMRLEEGMDAVPDLAEEIVVSPDGLDYRFRLREGACWSDGEPVTAADFAFTITAMQADPEQGGAYLLASVASVEATDERTLELRLEAPLRYFPYIIAASLSFPWPRHRVEADGDRWHDPERLVGNGPFVLEEVTPERIHVAANPRWDRDRGNVREVVWVNAPHDIDTAGWKAQQLAAWRSRTLDVMQLLTVSAAEALAGEDDASVAATEGLQVEYLGVSPTRPPLDDVRVRRALAHAINRARVVCIPGQRPYTGGVLPPAMPGHTPELAPAEDIELARKLLAEAGYPQGRDLPELTLRVLALWPGTAALVEQWTALGIRIRLETVRMWDFYAPSPTPFVCAAGWAADFPDPAGMLDPICHEPGMFAAAGPGAEVESLLAAAAASTDRAQQLGLYRQLDHLLVTREAFFIPIAIGGISYATRSSLQGLWHDPLGQATFDRIVVRRTPGRHSTS